MMEKRTIFWCSLCLSLFLHGCLVHVKPSVTSSPCPRLSKDKLTGWVEQIGDLCVQMVSPTNRVFFLSPRSLPFGVKEGDFLVKGKKDLVKQKAAEKEVKKLLAERPLLPRVYRLSSPSSPILSKRKRFRRGRWRRWQAKREKDHIQRKKRRFRQVWRRKWSKR